MLWCTSWEVCGLLKKKEIKQSLNPRRTEGSNLVNFGFFKYAEVSHIWLKDYLNLWQNTRWRRKQFFTCYVMVQPFHCLELSRAISTLLHKVSLTKISFLIFVIYPGHPLHPNKLAFLGTIFQGSPNKNSKKKEKESYNII